MAELKCKRLSGATLLETMVALTISVFLFSMVTVLFVQVTAGSASIKKCRAHELLYNWSTRDFEEEGYPDRSLNKDEFIIKQHFFANDTLPGIVRGRFSIYDQHDHLLDEIDRLILRVNQ